MGDLWQPVTLISSEFWQMSFITFLIKPQRSIKSEAAENTATSMRKTVSNVYNIRTILFMKPCAQFTKFLFTNPNELAISTCHQALPSTP